ncbi:hypothetical protein DM860_017698 [Cuscuta australis]|uniref:C2H2-type domain-containing protein n=1 Tax=Cuscuta australis TaxID=267555 RepID=A0A328DA11_9ASTE|nr:hypothetical protein DM860_017698 [Cuscuta australis]
MMEQEDQETVLMKMNRYFSLGRHTRSHNHLIPNPPESGETTQSHVLIRENLNKSFEVAAAESNAEEKHEEDALLLQRKLCKECGKKFESWKALFGHMKCHSQRTAKGFAGFPKRKKRSRRRAMMMTRYEVDNNSSTLTSANSDYDQEEVAMSLIMLSNNDNNPEVLGSQLKKQKPRGSEIPTTNETKFQCSTCSKAFHSYQALGGHRASHKKNYNNDGFAPPSQAMSEKVESSKKMKADDDRHECPICFKIFGSGQALGGHKRSHFKVGATKTDMQQQPETQKPETRDFLDLNFPAPVEEEEEDRERQQIIGFQAWLMMGRNYSHEQIVGPTSF